MAVKQNCIIIHGCPSGIEKAMDPATRTYDKHWIPWAKETLETLGIGTKTPLMPTPWAPKYEDWKKEFEKNRIDKYTILIGHSCGSAFLVRWLGEAKRKVRKLILVAPWKTPSESKAEKKIFYTFDVNPEIKDLAGEIIMFTADNEEQEGKKSLETYKKSFGGKVIELKGRGHYVFGDMGTVEFPELIEQIAKFNNRKALIIPINPQRKIFIQDRRGYKKPDWGYFGGEIENGEAPLQALIRETKEELSIYIQESQLKYLGVSVTSWGGDKVIRYMYLFPTKQQEFTVLEGKGGHWLTFAEAKERLENPDRFDEVATRIEQTLAN